MAEQEPLQGITQMLHEVATLNARDGRRRPLPNPFAVETTAIVEQIQHVMALELADNRPQASPSLPGPVIESNHPWGRQGGKGRAMDEA
jgi:hypothetical protein